MGNSLKQLLSAVGVEPALFLYALSTFIEFPIFQSLIFDKICAKEHGEAVCLGGGRSIVHSDIALQTEANYLFMLATVCITVPTIVVTFVLGSVSDRKSRKMAMLLPFVGLAFSTANNILQSTFFSLSAYWLLPGQFVFGLFGGFSSIFSTMFAYGGKQSKNAKHRSFRMAALEGSIGAGGTVGYVLSGTLLKLIGYRYVFLLSEMLSVSAFFYIVFRIPEVEESDAKKVVQSAASSNNQPESTTVHSGQTCSNLVLYFKDAYMVLFKQRLNSGRRRLLLNLTAFALEYFTFQSVMDISFYYLKHRLDWHPQTYGIFMGATYATSSLAVLVAFPTLRNIGLHDAFLILFGLACKSVAFIILAFSSKTWIAFTVVIFYTFNRFPSSGLRALLSRSVEQGEQGKLFAIVSVSTSLISLIASGIMNTLFPITLNFMSGFCFLILAALLLIPMAIVLHTHLRYADTLLHNSNSENHDGENVGVEEAEYQSVDATEPENQA